MNAAPLGRTDLVVSRLGFGAFKIGRNVGIKYASDYELPDDDAVERLLLGVVELGISYVDTAPAYGLSEQRVGRVLGRRRDVVISTKIGETFVDGAAHYDYGAAATRASIDRSRARLGREALDLVLVHSNGDDRAILESTDVVETLADLKRTGAIRWIGFSGKTVDGARRALAWADAIMVEYHLDDRSHAKVIATAGSACGVVVKKGLASGRLPAAEAIRFVTSNPDVDAMVIGGLRLEHVASNIAAVANPT